MAQPSPSSRARCSRTGSNAVQMQDVITDEQPFEGTSGQLLELLRPPGEDRPPRDWPKNARAATTRLHRLAPAFRKLGWTFDDIGRGDHGKQLRFRISPPARPETSGDDARTCLPRPQDDGHAGTAGIGGHENGPSQDGGQEKNAGPSLCTSCGEPLDQALVDLGLTDHGEGEAVPSYPASLKRSIAEKRRQMRDELPGPEAGA